MIKQIPEMLMRLKDAGLVFPSCTFTIGGLRGDARDQCTIRIAGLASEGERRIEVRIDVWGFDVTAPGVDLIADQLDLLEGKVLEEMGTEKAGR